MFARRLVLNSISVNSLIIRRQLQSVCSTCMPFEEPRVCSGNSFQIDCGPCCSKYSPRGATGTLSSINGRNSSILQLECVDCITGTLDRVDREGSAFTVKCNNLTMTFDKSSQKPVYEGCLTTLGLNSGYLLWTLENEPELLLEEAEG